jgi:hypothetical protein
VRVGHGTHTWERDDPCRAPAALPPGATVRDLMDDQARWEEVVAVAVETGAFADEPALARRLAAFLDAPVASAVDALTIGPPSRRLDDLRKRVAAILPSGSARSRAAEP